MTCKGRLMLVIAGLSAVGTGFFFESRMDRKAARMADLVRSQALMVQQRGEQLEALASRLAASPDRGAVRSHADELEGSAVAMQRYADGLMRKMQIEDPQAAMTEMADVNPLAPEDLNRIKRMNEQLEALSQENQELKARVADLQRRLYACMAGRSPFNRPHPDSSQGGRPQIQAC